MISEDTYISIILSLLLMLFVFVILRVSELVNYKFAIFTSIGFGIIGFFLARLGHYIAKKDEYDEMFERENEN